MRIAHIATRHIVGGASRNLSFAMETELAQGADVHLLAGHVGQRAPIPQGVTIHVVPHLVRDVSLASDVIAFRRLHEVMASLRADIVHTHQSKAGILGRLASRELVRAIVHTVHMPSFGRAYGWRSRPYLSAERWCGRFTDRMVFVGEELRDLYIAARIIEPNKTVVIRSPIDMQPFLAARDAPGDDRLSSRERLEVPADARMLVAVGALEPRKRLDLVLTRLAPLLKSGQTYLVVAGEGYLEVSLRTLAATLGIGHQVRFIGHVDNLPHIFSAADALVHAATVEGVPQVVLQALAASLPVVATSVEGLREIESVDLRVVEPSGDDLLPAVRDVLGVAVRPVKPTAFEAWHPTTVRAGQLRLYRELVDTCGL